MVVEAAHVAARDRLATAEVVSNQPLTRSAARADLACRLRWSRWHSCCQTSPPRSRPPLSAAAGFSVDTPLPSPADQPSGRQLPCCNTDLLRLRSGLVFAAGNSATAQLLPARCLHLAKRCHYGPNMRQFVQAADRSGQPGTLGLFPCRRTPLIVALLSSIPGRRRRPAAVLGGLCSHYGMWRFRASPLARVQFSPPRPGPPCSPYGAVTPPPTDAFVIAR